MTTFGTVKINECFNTPFTSAQGFTPYLKCSNTEAINLMNYQVETFDTNTEVELYQLKDFSQEDIEDAYKKAGKSFISEKNVLQVHVITKTSLDDVKAELNTWLESNYDKEIKTIEFEKVDSEFIFIIYHYIKKEK